MAAAIVRAPDALWDIRGGHDPMVTATMTHHNRSPDPAGRKRGSSTRSKSRPHSSNARAYKCVKPWAWSEN
jgi:hypothetical protein